MLRLAWRYRNECLFILLLQSLLLVMALSGLGLTGLGIDYIAFKVGVQDKQPRWPWGLQPPTDWSPMHVIGTIALLIVAIAAVRSLLHYLAAVAQGRLVNQKIVVHLRSAVYNKLQRLSFRFFDANESGSIINRVTGDVQAVRQFIDQVLMQSIMLTISLTFYLFYMLQIHVALTLWCLVTTPLLAVMSVVFSRLVRPAYRRNRVLYDRMIVTLAENVQGVHVVKGFARESEEVGKFADANREVKDQQWWIFKMVSRFVPGVGMVTQINLVILLGYGGYLYTRGEISIGQGLAIFAVLLQNFSNQVAATANIANSIQHSLIGAQRVFEVLDAPVDIKSPANPRKLDRARGEVAFEHVTFGYKPDDPVLSDVSFHIQPGTCVAIVGATGSGKSTLMSLIPRFYDPQQGVVRIDGIDIREVEVDALRRNVGLVFQESFLFSTTVAANIAFGHPDATREQIEKAARIAAAHEFISELSQGYDTPVGERGNDLSGGQKQRLAIARAILLEPAILLMDDPTAAIDPETEHEILVAMDSAMRGRTTFIVAHRLSTLRRADLILVLDAGRIVQTGTHDELMQQKGHYRRAAKLQIADPESLALLGMTEGEA
jgi:ABC-type multidrug transport system fused ATPase/permease subunit